MEGRKKCKILRDIRRKIAEENEIELITDECQYKGKCSGTCPKCESELRYLESELEKRKKLGKRITVSALALGLTVAVGGCSNSAVVGKTTGDDTTDPTAYSELEGDVAAPEYTDENGENTDATECSIENSGGPDEEGYVLEGDVEAQPYTGNIQPDGNA